MFTLDLCLYKVSKISLQKSTTSAFWSIVHTVPQISLSSLLTLWEAVNRGRIMMWLCNVFQRYLTVIVVHCATRVKIDMTFYIIWGTAHGRKDEKILNCDNFPFPLY